MKPRNQPNGGSKPASTQEITPWNYPEIASAFAAKHGGPFIIRSIDGEDGANATSKPATEAEWIAWLRYFDRNGIGCNYGRRRGCMPVPAQWPEDFDPMAHKSDKTARQRLTPIYAVKIPAASLKALGDAIRPSKRLSAPRPPAKPQTPEDLAAEYATRPLTVSPALIAVMQKLTGGH